MAGFEPTTPSPAMIFYAQRGWAGDSLNISEVFCETQEMCPAFSNPVEDGTRAPDCPSKSSRNGCMANSACINLFLIIKMPVS
jgi:hypothetical protein